MKFFLEILFVVGINLIVTCLGRVKYNDKGYPIYKCNVPEDHKNTCKFLKLRLNETNYHFQPIVNGNTVDKIEQVAMNTGCCGLASRVTVLSNDVCNFFPNLKVFNASKIHLKKIEPGALDNCKELERLYLRANDLSHLDENIFKHNTKLKRINLSNNHLTTSVVVSILNQLPHLTHIYLAQNQIRNFPIDEINALDDLEVLDLSNNIIHDLDVGKIAAKFPKLKDLALCAADFERFGQSKTEVIEETFSLKDVEKYCS